MEGQESEDDEAYARFNKNKNSKKVGRKPQWSKEATNDLVDIILDDDKLEEKLLLTNVKNSEYYNLVINELSQRCGQRNTSFEYDIIAVNILFLLFNQDLLSFIYFNRKSSFILSIFISINHF